MTTREIREEERQERIEYKQACVLGRYLQGQLKPSDSEIIRRLQCEANSFRAE